MEDAQIIELFFARSEDAISELDMKYGKLCHKLADNIATSSRTTSLQARRMRRSA